jgi:hypothetical protein
MGLAIQHHKNGRVGKGTASLFHRSPRKRNERAWMGYGRHYCLKKPFVPKITALEETIPPFKEIKAFHAAFPANFAAMQSHAPRLPTLAGLAIMVQVATA